MGRRAASGCLSVCLVHSGSVLSASPPRPLVWTDEKRESGRLAGDPVCSCVPEKRGRESADRPISGGCVSDLPSWLPYMGRVGYWYSRDEGEKSLASPNQSDVVIVMRWDARREGRCCVWVYDKTLQCMHVCGSHFTVLRSQVGTVLRESEP